MDARPTCLELVHVVEKDNYSCNSLTGKTEGMKAKLIKRVRSCFWCRRTVFAFTTFALTGFCVVKVIKLNLTFVKHQPPQVTYFGDSDKTLDLTRKSDSSPTLVTAYFDLGTIKKGSPSNKRGKGEYSRWGEAWGNIANSVIFYTDNQEFADHFTAITRLRRRKNHHVKLIDRNHFYSFNTLEPKIAKAFKTPGYPRHFPNTVNSMYSATMHAKYDLILDTIRQNPFNTTHFAWLDFGYFRNPQIWNSSRDFRLRVPDSLGNHTIAFSQINDLRNGLTPRQVIADNLVWACGGYFVCALRTCEAFASFYQKLVGRLAEQNSVSTDQQAVYAMFLDSERPAHSFRLRTYLPGNTGYKDDGWMFLGQYSAEELWPALRVDKNIEPVTKNFRGTFNATSTILYDMGRLKF